MCDFVYVGDECDYSRYCVQDIASSLKNVYCCMPPQYNAPKCFFRLCRFHNSSRFTSRGIVLPFRKIWRKCILDKETKEKLFSSSNKKCFIFTAEGAKYIGMGALDYLHKLFPDCLTVCTFNDKVDLHKRRRGFDLGKLKSAFDYVCTYDSIDAEAYNLLPSPPAICNYSNVETDVTIPESDLFFVGRMKLNAPDRLNELYSIFETATKNGLKCDFYISGVKEKPQRYSGLIHYNEPLAYYDVLKHVKRTKAIVNLSQRNVSALTLRDYEAIGMGKILISNNNTIVNSEYFNPELFIPFSELETGISRINEKTLSQHKWNNVVVYDIRQWEDWMNSTISKGTKDE